MADENTIPQVENEQVDARRTLKLRPAATNPAGSQLADPMHGDTDTSNLDVLDDTQTRKTIKIKPLNPTAPQINIGALQQTPAATPLSGTQTRKTVVLKSPAAAGTTPISGTQTRKSVVISPAAAGTTPISGTQTRRTVVLKPAVKPTVPDAENAAPATPATPATPAVPEAPASTGDIDDTVTRKAAVIDTPAPEDEKTVKITRPKFAKPAPVDPKRTVKLGTVAIPSPVSAPAPAEEPAPEQTTETAPVPVPAIESTPAEQEETPTAAPIPEETESAIPPVPPILQHSATQSAVTEVLPPTMAEGVDLPPETIPEPPHGELNIFPDTELTDDKPSVLYLVLAILALILLIAGAAFTAAQYLDFDHAVDIYKFIPGLPQAGK